MSMKRMMLVLGMVCALVLGSTSNAFAQSDDDHLDRFFFRSTMLTMGSTIMTSSTTSTLVMVPVGGVILTVVLATREGKNDAVEEYINHNIVAIQHDLYLGGGDSARDLAQILEIPAHEFDIFARILFENRQELASVLQTQAAGPGRAEKFMEIISGAMIRDVFLEDSVDSAS